MSSTATGTGTPGPQTPNSASNPWYEATNEVPIGPARPKRMPAGRHVLIGTAAPALRGGGQSIGKPAGKESAGKASAGKQSKPSSGMATATASAAVAKTPTTSTSEQPRSQPIGAPFEQQQSRTNQLTATTTEQWRDQAPQGIPAERFGFGPR